MADKLVVIGASQGGLHALTTLVRGLGRDFPAPILVVLHIGAEESQLPSILKEAGGLPASFGEMGQEIQSGHIHVAPPDQHMLVVDGRLELNRGPRENWSRPAVDPLLRSAALWYGADAIGIILTGRLNDGTSGLYEIKRHGGVAVVQTPSEAEAPGMPQSALDNVAIDYCLPVAEMPRLLTRLTAEPKQRREIAGDRAMPQDNRIVQPSAQTCPECGGAMREETTGSFKKYRCHIGHVMTAEILAAAQLETLENTLSTSLRLLNERAALCRDIAERHLANGNRRAGDVWKRAADEAAHREERAKEMVQAGWAHPEAAEAES